MGFRGRRLRLFRGGGVLPPILRRFFLPLALEQLSSLPYRRFCAGHRHIRRIMDKIIDGTLHLVLGILAGCGLPVIHQRRRIPLGADKGVFHPLAHNSGFVQHFDILAFAPFTGLNFVHGRSPRLFIQRCFRSAGAT